jgi:DNA (cytosine-5)-methyltransferase 1
MKQQTFIAENCLNPWDTQQSQVFTEDGTSPTLAGADGGGGRNPAGLVFAAFSGGAGAKARTIGYSEKVSPTLKSAACGLSSPCVCEPRIARTLTARGDSSPCADRGQNVVAISARQGQAGQVIAAGFGETGKGYWQPGIQTLHAEGENRPSRPGNCLVSQCSATGKDDDNDINKDLSAAPEVHPPVSGTLCASGAGLSRPAGMVSETDLCVVYAPQDRKMPETLSLIAREPIPIQNKATRHKGGGPTRNGDGAGNGLGVGNPGDPSPTLTSGAIHAVAAVFNRQHSDLFGEQDIASTQSARQYKDATDIVCKQNCYTSSSYGSLKEGMGTLRANGGDNGGGSENLVVRDNKTAYIVRRLTPTECERLQGYPDGWTALGHDGKPISDSKRYQMLGNSICVNCVAFIMSGIAAQIYSTEQEDVCNSFLNN